MKRTQNRCNNKKKIYKKNYLCKKKTTFQIKNLETLKFIKINKSNQKKINKYNYLTIQKLEVVALDFLQNLLKVLIKVA